MSSRLESERIIRTSIDGLHLEPDLTYVLPWRIENKLEEYRKRMGLCPQQMNVLDYGCGSGKSVLWLLQRGYNAYGVDISQDAIRDAERLLKKEGHANDRVSVLSENGRSPYSDSFFHFSFSAQVLEHVEDLPAVARELQRVMASGSESAHHLPGQRRIMEVHCGPMPFIHWLPKNWLRKTLLCAYVSLSLEKRNPATRETMVGCTFWQRVERCYQYSVRETYYRSYSEVGRTFEKEGFKIKFDPLDHPFIKRHKGLSVLLGFKLMRVVMGWLVLTFVSISMTGHK